MAKARPAKIVRVLQGMGGKWVVRPSSRLLSCCLYLLWVPVSPAPCVRDWPSHTLAPGPSYWLCLSLGPWRAFPCWFPWWLISQPGISLYNWQSPLPPGRKPAACPAQSVALVGYHPGPCFRCGRSPSIKPLMSLLLKINKIPRWEDFNILMMSSLKSW